MIPPTCKDLVLLALFSMPNFWWKYTRYKEEQKSLVIASKETDVEVNAAKTKYKVVQI